MKESGLFSWVSSTPRWLLALVGVLVFGDAAKAQCTARTRLNASCQAKGTSHTVKAKVKYAVPNGVLTLTLDGQQPQRVQLNQKGKGKTSWNGVPVGLHNVTIIDCGIGGTVLCW